MATIAISRTIFNMLERVWDFLIGSCFYSFCSREQWQGHDFVRDFDWRRSSRSMASSCTHHVHIMAIAISMERMLRNGNDIFIFLRIQ
jgi:hypothetical protein